MVNEAAIIENDREVGGILVGINSNDLERPRQNQQ
jgi:hypothetical protein